MIFGRLLTFALMNLLGFLVLQRLWPALASGWRRGAFIGLVGVSLLAWALPVALGYGTHGQVPVVGLPLKLFATAWAIAVSIVMVFGAPFALVRWWRQRRAAVPAGGAQGGVDLERRSLLVNAGRAVPFVAVGTSSAGVMSGLSGFELREVEVPLKNLPAAFEGFRIGHGGAAVRGDLVYLTTPDAHLVALDARTGSVRWNASGPSSRSAAHSPANGLRTSRPVMP
mgnify:CR=1 FL=1